MKCAAALVVWSLVMVAWGAEVAPTRPLDLPHRTQPPTEESRPQFAQTLYKATDYSIIKNTLIPIWPSYSVEYYSTETTTTDYNITVHLTEWSTVLNTTVDYYTPDFNNNSLNVAPTSYQTMEFQHQTVIYTDRKNITHTEIQENDLPLI